MWNFEAIRELAIDKLEKIPMDPAQKYLIALETRVEQWVVPSLTSLATRKEPLSMADVDRLGLDCVLRLARIREERAPKAPAVPKCTSTYYECNNGDYGMQYTCSNCGNSYPPGAPTEMPDYVLTQAICTVFELKS